MPTVANTGKKIVLY